MRYDYVLFSGALPYITKLFSIDLMFIVYCDNFWKIVTLVPNFEVGMLEAHRTSVTQKLGTMHFSGVKLITPITKM